MKRIITKENSVKPGDLVYEPKSCRYGIVEKVDLDYFGARQAFKVYKALERGKCIRGDEVDGYGPTKEGIRDRVLVCWTDSPPEYFPSNRLEVVDVQS
jgi:hypothetical protein